jgi:hypothetical protein
MSAAEDLVNLNFKVPAQLHYDFKMQALVRGTTNVGLLIMMFRQFNERNPIRELGKVSDEAGKKNEKRRKSRRKQRGKSHGHKPKKKLRKKRRPS